VSTFGSDPHDRHGAAAPFTIVPANEASWEHLQAVFGQCGEASRCQCQRYTRP
jgi:hypothetical protein